MLVVPTTLAFFLVSPYFLVYLCKICRLWKVGWLCPISKNYYNTKYTVGAKILYLICFPLKQRCRVCVQYCNLVHVSSALSFSFLLLLLNLTNLGLWKNKDRATGRSKVCCGCRVICNESLSSMCVVSLCSWCPGLRWCRLPVEWRRHLQSHGAAEEP